MAPVGGRLSPFATSWKKISGSSWILNIIREGDLSFLLLLTCFYYHKIHSSLICWCTMEKEINSIIGKGGPCSGSARRKAMGFLYIHLSGEEAIWNQFLVYQKFKMETRKSTINLLCTECFMTSI